MNQCLKCVCCSVCLRLCQCGEDASTPEGMLAVLGLGLPSNKHKIMAYIEKKKSEEKGYSESDSQTEASSESFSENDDSE